VLFGHIARTRAALSWLRTEVVDVVDSLFVLFLAPLVLTSDSAILCSRNILCFTKRSPTLFSRRWILIIFGMNVSQKAGNWKIVKFLTSHYLAKLGKLGVYCEVQRISGVSQSYSLGGSSDAAYSTTAACCSASLNFFTSLQCSLQKLRNFRVSSFAR